MANFFQRIGSWAKVFWKVLNQQPEILSDVAFSPDGATIALAGKSAVWLLDTSNGEELAVLAGASELLAFSPDGATLATGSTDGVIKLWRTRDGRENGSLLKYTPPLYGLAYAPKGERVAVAVKHQPVSVWDARTAKRLLRLEDPGGWAVELRFGPGGQTLWTASATTRLWDLRTGKVVVEFHWNPKIIERGIIGDFSSQANARAFSPDGIKAAAGGGYLWHASQVAIWDARTGAHRDLVTLHEMEIQNLLFSPDSRRLAVFTGRMVGGQAGVKVFDLIDLDRDPLTLPGASKALAFSPDGRWLATGFGGHGVTIWDLSTGKTVRRCEYRGLFAIDRLQFSPRGCHLAGLSDLNRMVLWEITSGEGRCVVEKKLFRNPSPTSGPNKPLQQTGPA